MDNEYKNYKADRVLKLLFRALKGESLSVAALADESNVSTRSITRDINDLKAFLADYRDIPVSYTHLTLPTIRLV